MIPRKKMVATDPDARYFGKIIGVDGDDVIIRCTYGRKGAEIGDPCRVIPHKWDMQRRFSKKIKRCKHKTTNRTLKSEKSNANIGKNGRKRSRN